MLWFGNTPPFSLFNNGCVMFHVKDSQHLLGWSEYFVFSSIRHFLSWKNMSIVSAMYDKMSLSVATPFQTWETPSTGVTVCCMSSFTIFPKASQSSLTSLWLAQMPLNGMPSSKCSRRIVWSEQTNLDYSVGTTCPAGILLEQHWLISWTHTDFKWIKVA